MAFDDPNYEMVLYEIKYINLLLLFTKIITVQYICIIL